MLGRQPYRHHSILQCLVPAGYSTERKRGSCLLPIMKCVIRGSLDTL